MDLIDFHEQDVEIRVKQEHDRESAGIVSEDQKIVIKIETEIKENTKDSQLNDCKEVNCGKMSNTMTKGFFTPFKCKICDKPFGNRYDLERHRLTHKGEKPHECKICDKKFSGKDHLLMHKRTHTCEKPYQCNICNKAFSKIETLVRHHRIHDKPYKCEICDEAFSNLSCLKRHQKIHKGEKCDICDKVFRDKAKFLRHKDTRHKKIRNFLSADD